MVTQDNRLLSLSSKDHTLDRPLLDLTQPVAPVAAAVGATAAQPIHLRDYVMVVLKRKWLILSLVTVITSLVAIQMYRLPNVYEAVSQVQIEPKSSVLSGASKEAIVFNSAQRDAAYWNTQIRLLQNPQLARQVVLALDLQNNPSFLQGQSAPSILTSLRRIFARKQAAAPKEQKVQVVGDDDQGDGASNRTEQLTPEQLAQLEPYEDALQAGLGVEPIDKTNLVNIHFTHTNPELAANIANTLAQVFIANDLHRDTTGSETAAGKLAREIADLQMKIKQDEDARIAYLQNNNLPLTPDAKGANLTAVRLDTLSGQLLAAEKERTDLKAAVDEASKAADPMDIPEVQSNDRIQKIQERLMTVEQGQDDTIAGLERTKRDLLVTYTEQWPGVVKIDEQIAQIRQDNQQTRKLRESLAKAPKEVVKALKLRYEASIARVNRLRQAYDQERAAANKQGVAEINMSNLEQRIATNKQFYNTLYQRLKELEITNTDRAGTITLAMPSREPRVPIGPARTRNIIIAFILSIGVGIGLAFLLDYLDDSLKSIEDVDRYIHLPTLALIPAPRADRRLLKGKASAAADSKELGDDNNGTNSATALALIDDVRSPVAEAYRHLRTSLLLSSAGQRPKTILVTSSQPSEGKTTTAVNTAVMLAQTGVEVLIIDCDLRRPRIHHHFGVANNRGITNYLSGEKDLDAVLQSTEKLPNLKVMSSGPVPPNPAELLGSSEMRKLLHQLGERFTHIIIDSPPAISFTDASLLSTLVDGVMLVVHGGKTSRAVVQRARQQLLDVGAHVYGVVLNNLKIEANNSYYYYMYGGYYYSNYYSSSDDEANAEVAAVAEGADRPGANG